MPGRRWRALGTAAARPAGELVAARWADPRSGPPVPVTAPASAPYPAGFRRLWAAHSVSSIGDEIVLVALPLAVYAATSSAFAVGVVAAMEGVTVILFGLFAGVAADRWRRRVTLLLTDLARAVALAGLVAALWLHAPAAAFAVAAFALGAVRILHDSVAGASVPLVLATPSQLLGANSRLYVSSSVANGAGPALSAGLLAAGGPAAALGGAASSFAVSAGLLRRIRDLDEHDRASDPATVRDVLAELRAGLRVLFADRAFCGLVAVGAAVNIVAVAAEAHFIPYAREVLGVSTAGVAGFFVVGGVVSVVVAVAVSRRVVARGDLTCAGLAIMAVGVLIAGLWPSIGTAVAMFVLAGVGAPLGITHFQALRHHRFRPDVLGRVIAATRVLLFAAVPPAYLAGGWLAEATDPTWLLISAAAVGLAAAAAGWVSPAGRLRAD